MAVSYYSHKAQKDKIGLSSGKIFDGEDLSSQLLLFSFDYWSFF